MKHVDYFKLQAKNFMRDFKTRNKDETGIYQYNPRFFPDIDDIILSYDIEEDDFTLMNAQHIIALLAGFGKWSDLLHASEAKLELGKLLLEHRQESDSFGTPILSSWEMYQENLSLGDEGMLAVFKAMYLNQDE